MSNLDLSKQILWPEARRCGERALHQTMYESTGEERCARMRDNFTVYFETALTALNGYGVTNPKTVIYLGQLVGYCETMIEVLGSVAGNVVFKPSESSGLPHVGAGLSDWPASENSSAKQAHDQA